MLGIANQEIINYIGTPAILEQSAEECNELSQACLKMARKLRDENPTPKTLDDIRENLVEELSDVMLCIDYIISTCNIRMDEISPMIVEKQNRWIDRIIESVMEEQEETIQQETEEQVESIQQEETEDEH